MTRDERERFQVLAGRFEHESDILVADTDRMETEESVALTLAQAKRVRARATDLIRFLADLRDSQSR